MAHETSDAFRFPTKHKCPSYNGFISLDTWFICNLKLMLFRPFSIYTCHRIKPSWVKYPLIIGNALHLKYEFHKWMALTSVFDDKQRILYILAKHFQYETRTLITVNVKALKCIVYDIRLEFDECYAFIINNNLNIIDTTGHFAWDINDKHFCKIKNLSNIEWNSQPIYIPTGDMMLLFHTNKLFGYSMKNKKIATIQIRMPEKRMKNYGMVSCIKDRYILMFSGDYDYGLKSQQIIIYDIYDNSFGYCSIRSPIKGNCKAIVANYGYDERVTAGFIRKISKNCDKNILHLIKTVFLSFDIIYLFSCKTNSFYWQAYADDLINNATYWGFL